MEYIFAVVRGWILNLIFFEEVKNGTTFLQPQPAAPKNQQQVIYRSRLFNITVSKETLRLKDRTVPQGDIDQTPKSIPLENSKLPRSNLSSVLNGL